MGATPVGILNGYNVSGMGILGRNQPRVLVGFGLKEFISLVPAIIWNRVTQLAGTLYWSPQRDNWDDYSRGITSPPMTYPKISL